MFPHGISKSVELVAKCKEVMANWERNRRQEREWDTRAHMWVVEWRGLTEQKVELLLDAAPTPCFSTRRFKVDSPL